LAPVKLAGMSFLQSYHRVFIRVADPDAHPIRAVSTHPSPMTPQHPSKITSHPPHHTQQKQKPGSSSSSSSNHTDATQFTHSASSSSAFTSSSSIAPAIKVSFPFVFLAVHVLGSYPSVSCIQPSHNAPALRRFQYPLHLRPSHAVDTFDFFSTLTSHALKVDLHLLRLNNKDCPQTLLIRFTLLLDLLAPP
jgi:hypothetical protein